MGGKNLQCMLCTSRPPQDVLRKHIQSQHLIVKESAVDKIYEMHFPKEVVSIETQTTMTWINQLEDLEKSVASIDENLEKITSPPDDKLSKFNKSLISVPELDLQEQDIPQDFVPDQEEMVSEEYDLALSPTTSEIGANPDSPEFDSVNIQEPETVDDNDKHAIFNISLDSGSKIDEDDEGSVIIREENVDFSGILFPVKQNIINPKETELFNSDSSSLSENPLQSSESSEKTTIPASEQINDTDEYTEEELIENDSSEDKIKEAFPTWIRYRCPYCDFVGFKKYVVDDHIVSEHADKKYGEGKKQKMYVGIERDSSLVSFLQVQSIQNFDIPDKMLDDLDDSKEDIVFGDFSEVNDEIASNIEESFLEDEPEWHQSDATLPIGWLFSDVVVDDGKINKQFMSPCKKTFLSRDEVAEFLIDQGKKIVRAGGFKVPNAEKSRCDAMCEGNCKLFTVPKSFYHLKDKNRIRKKTKLNFIDESQVPKSNRAKDKMVKGVQKFKPVEGIKYRKASQKLARAWLLLIEESENQQPKKSIEQKVEKDNRTSEKSPSITESKTIMVPASQEENNVKKNNRPRRSIAQNNEVEKRETRSDKQAKTERKTETHLFELQDKRMKENVTATEKLLKYEAHENEKEEVLNKKKALIDEGTSIRSTRRTPRKSIAVTPVKDNVTIAMGDENSIPENSSVIKENLEQGEGHCKADNTLRDKKEKIKQQEKSVRDGAREKEKIEVIHEDILRDEKISMDEGDKKKKESGTEYVSSPSAGTPVQKTRRTPRKSVSVIPVNETVTIVDKNAISESSSITKENQEQEMFHSKSDNISTEEKEKEELQEKLLKDKTQKKEKEDEVPLQKTERTLRKSGADTPVKENVPIASAEKDNIVEISSVTLENQAQDISHSNSDKTIPEKKEEQQERDLKDKTNKKENEDVTHENISNNEDAMVDNGDNKKKDNVTEGKSATCVGTPVQNTRRILRRSVAIADKETIAEISSVIKETQEQSRNAITKKKEDADEDDTLLDDRLLGKEKVLAVEETVKDTHVEPENKPAPDSGTTKVLRSIRKTPRKSVALTPVKETNDRANVVTNLDVASVDLEDSESAKKGEMKLLSQAPRESVGKMSETKMNLMKDDKAEIPEKKYVSENEEILFTRGNNEKSIRNMPEKSIATTPVKENVAMDNSDKNTIDESTSGTTCLDNKGEKKEEIKHSSKLTRNLIVEMNEAKIQLMQYEEKVLSEKKHVSEKEEISSIKNDEDKGDKIAMRRSTLESKLEENVNESTKQNKDGGTAEQTLDIKKNKTSLTETVGLLNSSNVIVEDSEQIQISNDDKIIQEKIPCSEVDSQPYVSMECCPKTASDADRFTESYHQKEESAIPTAEGIDSKVHETVEDNMAQDSLSETSNETQNSDIWKGIEAEQELIALDLQTLSVKKKSYMEQNKEDLTESTENYQLYNDTEADAVVLKASPTTFDESEPENEEICLIQKTPSKKQQQRIDIPHCALIETDNISIQKNDISIPKEDIEKNKIKMPDSILKMEHNISPEIGTMNSKETEVLRNHLRKPTSEKELSFIQMDDESQQENEVVIIPAKSVLNKPSDYKNKIDVDSEIDKLKENEMISMVNFKESSLVELKLDDIEKVFASTDVEKNKEHEALKDKKETAFSSSIHSKNIENSNVPCTISIEEVNLVPDEKSDIKEFTHLKDIQSSSNTKIPEQHQKTMKTISSKRRRSQESASRIESPVAKKRRRTLDEDTVFEESKSDNIMENKQLPKNQQKTNMKDLEKKPKKTLASKFKKSNKSESDSDQEENIKRNIEKLKRLHKNELEINRNEGTYVQCCIDSCLKWRLVKEFEDPSMVPEYWVCSMNTDPRNNECGIGGHSFVSDAETVDVKFTCGSMVWAKMKGFPWWPGMVDYCPDCEEYYWIEEDISLTEPAWYNVVFFEGKGNSVSRAWVKKEDILKITLPIEPPKNTIKSASIRNKLANAIKMATDAKHMTREARLEKYSFAALFKGKWGAYVNLDSDTEETPSKKKKQVKKVAKNDERKLKSNVKEKFITGAISSDKSGRVSAIKKEIILKSTPESESCDDSDNRSDTNTEDENPIPSTSKAGTERESLKFVYKKDLVDKSIRPERSFGSQIKKTAHWEVSSNDSNYSKSSPPSTLIAAQSSQIVSPKKSTILGNLKYVNKALEDAQKNRYGPESKDDEFLPKTNPHLDKNHPKPPLPSDVLIALAVRNLDPNNHYGASFRSIIAFLTLHFPYFNRNVEECKDMVRRAYDINSREETGKENFRIKSSLVEQLSVRIKSYVERSKGMVKQAMLQADFLDTIVDRFVHGTKSNPACNFRPPYSCKMLSYLALVSICPPCSIEQIMIFITFLFPSLQNDKTAFKKEDFENAIRNDENVEEFYLPPNGQRMFILREGSYPVVLNTVRHFFSTKSNNIRLKKSIYNQDFVNMLLPNLITEEDPDET